MYNEFLRPEIQKKREPQWKADWTKVMGFAVVTLLAIAAGVVSIIGG